MEAELHFLPDGTVNLVVPKQAGVTFESAAPKLAAFAASLSIELGLPVTVVSEPERHLHGPEGIHVRAAHHAHA